MAVREVPPEQQEMENAQVLVDNCQSCIELCKTGTFHARRKPTNILDQKENLVESLSSMLRQLGSVAVKLAPEPESITRRPLKESSVGNAEQKSYPFLRSLLRRNRSKSENRNKSEKSRIIQKKKSSFRSRTKSERIIEIDQRDEQLFKMCNLINNLCKNVSLLVTQCFGPVETLDENIISIFENTWAGVFSFDANFYAFQNRSKLNPIIPKGMSYPTESDVVCLIGKLPGIFENILKIVPIPKLEPMVEPDNRPNCVQNLTECNRYLRQLRPVLRTTFVETVD